MRFNGATASNGRQQRGEALARQYLARARSQNHAAQAYGGSTGGSKSANPGLGSAVLAARSAGIGEGNQIFRDQGSGQLGGRRSLAEVRGLAAPRENTPANG